VQVNQVSGILIGIVKGDENVTGKGNARPGQQRRQAQVGVFEDDVDDASSDDVDAIAAADAAAASNMFLGGGNADPAHLALLGKMDEFSAAPKAFLIQLKGLSGQAKAQYSDQFIVGTFGNVKFQLEDCIISMKYRGVTAKVLNTPTNSASRFKLGLQAMGSCYSLLAYSLFDGRFRTWASVQGCTLKKPDIDSNIIGQGAIVLFPAQAEFAPLFTVLSRACELEQLAIVGFDSAAFLRLEPDLFCLSRVYDVSKWQYDFFQNGVNQSIDIVCSLTEHVNQTAIGLTHLSNSNMLSDVALVSRLFQHGWLSSLQLRLKELKDNPLPDPVEDLMQKRAKYEAENGLIPKNLRNLLRDCIKRNVNTIAAARKLINEDDLLDDNEWEQIAEYKIRLIAPFSISGVCDSLDNLVLLGGFSGFALMLFHALPIQVYNQIDLIRQAICNTYAAQIADEILKNTSFQSRRTVFLLCRGLIYHAMQFYFKGQIISVWSKRLFNEFRARTDSFSGVKVSWLSLMSLVPESGFRFYIANSFDPYKFEKVERRQMGLHFRWPAIPQPPAAAGADIDSDSPYPNFSDDGEFSSFDSDNAAFEIASDIQEDVSSLVRQRDDIDNNSNMNSDEPSNRNRRQKKS
jgi:hypothetical protein